MVINPRCREEHYPRNRFDQRHHCWYAAPFPTSHVITFRVASCCNEAFKIATSSAAYLNNYFMLIGTESVYSYTFEHEKRNDCPVCGGESLDISIPESWTVERLIEMLVERQDMCARSLAVCCPMMLIR